MSAEQKTTADRAFEKLQPTLARNLTVEEQGLQSPELTPCHRYAMVNLCFCRVLQRQVRPQNLQAVMFRYHIKYEILRNFNVTSLCASRVSLCLALGWGQRLARKQANSCGVR